MRQQRCLHDVVREVTIETILPMTQRAKNLLLHAVFIKLLFVWFIPVPCLKERKPRPVSREVRRPGQVNGICVTASLQYACALTTRESNALDARCGVPSLTHLDVRLEDGVVVVESRSVDDGADDVGDGLREVRAHVKRVPVLRAEFLQQDARLLVHLQWAIIPRREANVRRRFQRWSRIELSRV